MKIKKSMLKQLIKEELLKESNRNSQIHYIIDDDINEYLADINVNSVVYFESILDGDEEVLEFDKALIQQAILQWEKVEKNMEKLSDSVEKYEYCANEATEFIEYE